MSTLPPLSQFPPLNRPPPSSYWPIRGSTSQTKHASATHQSKFLAAEIEALSDEETQFEAAVGVFVFVNRNEADKRPPKWQHIRMRNWGSKHLKPAGRTTTWDEDEDVRLVSYCTHTPLSVHAISCCFFDFCRMQLGSSTSRHQPSTTH